MTSEQAICILRALKEEYIHPEVKEACDLAIECIEKNRRSIKNRIRKRRKNHG